MSEGRCEHRADDDEGTILHADTDSFYASIKQRDDRRLRRPPGDRRWRGRALGRLRSQGVRHVGTRSGGTQAPTPVPGGDDRSGRGSRPTGRGRAERCSGSFHDTTPLVEGLSWTRGVPRHQQGYTGCPARRARSRVHLRASVLERFGIIRDSGVARTKLLAKVATASPSPSGLLVVPVDGELSRSCTGSRSSACGRRTVGRRLNVKSAGSPRVAEVAGLGRARAGGVA